MSAVDAPCYQCPDRVLKCHSKCPKYQQFKDKIAQYNKQRSMQISSEVYDRTASKRRKYSSWHRTTHIE